MKEWIFGVRIIYFFINLFDNNSNCPPILGGENLEMSFRVRLFNINVFSS